MVGTGGLGALSLSGNSPADNRTAASVSDEIAHVTLSRYLYAVFGVGEAASFWKRGSNIGSSRSSAGVRGTLKISVAVFGDMTEETAFSARYI